MSQNILHNTNYQHCICLNFRGSKLEINKGHNYIFHHKDNVLNITYVNVFKMSAISIEKNNNFVSCF